ncbi:MAG: hypothetical protein GY906_03380 [bacterium]|nr:hypothetical protein [bacterium]
MKRPLIAVLAPLLCCSSLLLAQETEVWPGADEKTPSRSEYFSWINNTNEGATEEQTLINLEFFRWMHDEYGMQLDIYAFDAGAIDGKRFYGKIDSERFREQFPNGWGPIYEAAKAIGTRLGVWGGPDGFGDSPKEEAARTEQMVSLCRDLDFALFKFDAVCGPLRPEKEDAFIRMMTECRKHSPDLILLNHRLGLERAQAYATTFLWEGRETYIDVFATNRMTAPHHRADAMNRGLVPDLQRLTEDHGVCLSSSLDHWDDDLVLQAFNRALILSPQLYGSPWLLRDDELPRLARIFNLHRKYRDILVNGMVLPEDHFGPSAVSRGDASTRLISLRNLSWYPVSYQIPLDGRIGLEGKDSVYVRRLFPTERIFGSFRFGETVEVTIPPFRAYLLLATSADCDEPGVIGADFEVLRNVPNKPVQIQLLGETGTTAGITLAAGQSRYGSARLSGRNASQLLSGATLAVAFDGRTLEKPIHRKLAELEEVEIPADAEALYEATIFAADNNALEIRSLKRSGPTTIPQVEAARDAIFNQEVFTERGIWDHNLFDDDLSTGFWPSRKYRVDQRVKGGCFRLDLGKVIDGGLIVLHVPDDYSLQPILADEGNWVEVSTDLREWRRRLYMAGTEMTIDLDGPARYLRFPVTADRFVEITGTQNDRSLDRSNWRASNLFAHPSQMEPVKVWHGRVLLGEAVHGAKLAVAIEGIHGAEGAYAALKIGDRYVGAPDRAAAYPSNTWEYVNAKRDRGYTYYFPVTKDMVGQPIDVYVIGYDPEHTGLRPMVWHAVDPVPTQGPLLELE